MKSLTLILLFTLLVGTNLHSQESYIKNRWTLKLAYANYQINISNGAWKYETTGNYQLEADYGFLNFLEAGVFGGYSSWLMGNESLYTYGANFNVHILPFIIKTENFRFDAYLTGKVGGSIHRYEPYILPGYEAYNLPKIAHRNMLEYGVGLGGAFYLFKHFGVFAEYSFGKYFFIDNKKFRAGIVIKLNK